MKGLLAVIGPLSSAVPKNGIAQLAFRTLSEALSATTLQGCAIIQSSHKWRLDEMQRKCRISVKRDPSIYIRLRKAFSKCIPITSYYEAHYHCLHFISYRDRRW